MSNAKPYLFGAVLGASAMYVALQYHVVHSHDGFQMVPRTPQHSIGLAYADVRNWSPSQWTDRPELARALMAHGSSDLISESVANSLADSVTEENSTLDQLRSFLDKSAQDDVKGENGLMEIPASTQKPENTKSNADDVLTRIPFPQDARNIVAADPFRVAQSPESPLAPVQTPSHPAADSRFSAADVIDGLRTDGNNLVNSFIGPAPETTASAVASGKAAARTPAQQAQAAEDKIFSGSSSTSPTSNPATTSGTDSMFEEVSTQLENRAQAALNRAKEAASPKGGSTVSGSTNASEGYVRKNVEDAAPDATKSVIKNGTAETPTTPAATLLDQFDPFLE